MSSLEAGPPCAWTLLQEEPGKEARALEKVAFCVDTVTVGISGLLEHPAREDPPPGAGLPHLSLLLSAVISRPMASLLSVASSSSRCSFLRLALMRWDYSSSASSSCLLSCFTFTFPFSACQGEA